MSLGQLRHSQSDFLSQLSGGQVHAQVEVLLFKLLDALGLGMD
jgi:hypothetical protein